MIAQKIFGFLNSIQEKVISYLEGSKTTRKTTPASTEEIERVPLSADFIDLDTLEDMDRGSSVQFYETENSPLARDASRGVAKGIDKFDEDDSFEPRTE